MSDEYQDEVVLEKSTGIELPHSEEAERAVLGAILLDPDLMASASGLGCEHFYSEANQEIWGAFQAITTSRRVVDLVTVRSYLKLAGSFERVGGVAYLSELDTNLPDINRFDAYVEIIKDRAARRGLVDAFMRMADLAMGVEATAPDVASQAIALLEPIKQQAGATDRPWKTLRERLADPDILDLPEVIIPRLVWKGRATLLYGREKSGKSTLAGWAAAQLSRGAACLGGCELGTVLWVSCEEHPGDVARRFNNFRADPDRIRLLLKPAVGLDVIRAAATQHRPSLIVVDTLATLAASCGLVLESAAEWTPFLIELTDIARATNAGMLILHRPTKLGGYRDSTAIGAVPDVIASMEVDTSDATARTIKYVGRAGMEEYRIRYTGSGFETGPGTDLGTVARASEFSAQKFGGK